jgi:hypothetical protein
VLPGLFVFPFWAFVLHARRELLAQVGVALVLPFAGERFGLLFSPITFVRSFTFGIECMTKRELPSLKVLSLSCSASKVIFDPGRYARS